jgi:hypothetical protein
MNEPINKALMPLIRNFIFFFFLDRARTTCLMNLRA